MLQIFEQQNSTFEHMSKQNFYEQFEKAFQKLNESQKKAVNQIDGPVLVIAGPGTGKTQILAARIANILLQTDTNPENILCLMMNRYCPRSSKRFESM